jgi:hypothetical protein
MLKFFSVKAKNKTTLFLMLTFVISLQQQVFTNHAVTLVQA